MLVNKKKIKHSFEKLFNINKRYKVSFSKSGDDILLHKLINEYSPGLYLDIGSWKPIEASNTYFFYLRGWKGICVDPNPELIEKYKKVRPKDLFLNTAIGSDEGLIKYYMLNDKFSSMNSFDLSFIKDHQIESEIKEVHDIAMTSIESILDEHMSKNDRLDFFDIDVEGYDLNVLQTNNWKKYRPKLIAIESDVSIDEDINSEITNYLSSVNYKLIAKTVMNKDLGNLFFIDKKYYD